MLAVNHWYYGSSAQELEYGEEAEMNNVSKGKHMELTQVEKRATHLSSMAMEETLDFQVQFTVEYHPCSVSSMQHGSIQ